MHFTSLGLSAPILEAVADKGYKTLTPIQGKAIPAVLNGRDVMAAAQTGTGKTAGFTLPILERLSQGKSAGPNQARALVLTPTRELAAQVGESVATYGKNLSLRSAIVFGGVAINPQMKRLRKGVDILVATPGRLLDLYSKNSVRFPHLEVLVLDEADRMLDMGFIHDIRRILSLLPNSRQNLMFSATFSNDVRNLARGLVNNPVEISASPRITAAVTVRQWIYPVDKKRKSDLLSHLIRENNWCQVLVFTRTKHGANRLMRQLDNKGIGAAAIHGNKSQGARTRALSDFKNGLVQVLVATDIAARGLDINQLPQVVNFDLPSMPEDYIHRIGRTGRAGRSGCAVSLVSADEFQQLFDIERLIGKKLKRNLVDGFEPDHDVPESRKIVRPITTGKPFRSPQPSGDKTNTAAQAPKSGRQANSRKRQSTGKGGKTTRSGFAQRATSKPRRQKPRG